MRNRRMIQRGERGAVLIIVAVFSLVAVLMMAAVIDLGNHRQEVKRVTLSTDAAALAAASSIDFSDPDATGLDVDCAIVSSKSKTAAGVIMSVADVANRYWTQNGSSGPLGCRIFFDSTQRGTAYVTVGGAETVKYAFTGATGRSAGSAAGASSARVAGDSDGILYPVGLCTEGLTALGVGAQPEVFTPPRSTTVVFDAACGGSGNKRQIQFRQGLSGNQCAQEGMWCWDFNHGGYDPKGNVPLIVESDTGKDWQKAEATINALATSKTHIWIPAVKARPDLGASGTNAKYEVTHFVEVRIVSYSKRQGLGFEMYQAVPYSAGGPPALTTTYRARVHLCGTGQGTAACDVKTGPPPIYTSNPVLDFRDLCKVTSIVRPTEPVRVNALDQLLDPLTVSYTVENTANCDPPVILRLASAVRTFDRPAATPTPVSPSPQGTYSFTVPRNTTMARDGTLFTLQLIEGGYIADESVKFTIMGPCTVASASVTPSEVGSSGNKLSGPVTVRVNLTSAGPCTAITVELAQRKTNGDLGDINVIRTSFTPTSASFDVLVPKDAQKYANNSKFEVIVKTAGTTLAYTPVATLTTPP